MWKSVLLKVMVVGDNPQVVPQRLDYNIVDSWQERKDAQ